MPFIHFRGEFLANLAICLSTRSVQGSTRFILADGGDLPRWNIEAGLDYLNYGENSIFGSSTLRASYVAKRVGSCEIMPTAALQYQHFYNPEYFQVLRVVLG